MKKTLTTITLLLLTACGSDAPLSHDFLDGSSSSGESEESSSSSSSSSSEVSDVEGHGEGHGGGEESSSSSSSSSPSSGEESSSSSSGDEESSSSGDDVEDEDEDDCDHHKKLKSKNLVPLPPVHSFIQESQASVMVHSYEELKASIAAASTGDIIFVPNGSEIDFSGKPAIKIDKEITIASNRHVAPNIEGAFIFTDDKNNFPLFLVTADNVRITGLQIHGADGDVGTSAYGEPLSMAIEVKSRRIEVDNCEIFDFSYAGIRLDARLLDSSNHHIHHNNIHHIRRTGLGYGVVLNDAVALIEANYFEKNRHAIAGTGRPRTSYEARYNTVGEGYEGDQSSFDMHRMGEDPNFLGELVAGDTILIHHNNFLDPYSQAVYIRGVPGNIVEVHHNRILSADKLKFYSDENVLVHDNYAIKK